MFSWWITLAWKKHKKTTNKVRSKYWQRAHKLGIEIPKSVPGALEIDKQNRNHIWRESTKKEIPKTDNAVDEYDDNPSNITGYQKIMVYMIFDVKIGKKICRRVRFVDNGHKTETTI